MAAAFFFTVPIYSYFLTQRWQGRLDKTIAKFSLFLKLALNDGFVIYFRTAEFTTKQNNHYFIQLPINDKTMTTIAFVENHIMLRNLLVRSLECEIENCKVHVYDNGLDFVSRFPNQNYTPSIVLMDIRMPEMNGYETTKWIKKHYSNIPVLALSDLDEPRALEAIIESGSDGFTSKSSFNIIGRIPTIINQIIGGNSYFENAEQYHKVKGKMNAESKKSKVGINAISDVEMKVLRCLPSDKRPIKQAEELNMSVHTFNNHLKSIKTKIGNKTSKMLIVLAHKLGLIEL